MNYYILATVNIMRCVIRRNIAKSTDTALRLPEDDPKRVVFEGFCKSRLKRRYAKSEAVNLCKELGEHHHAPFECFTVKPWEKGLRKVSVFSALSGVSERDDNVDTIRIAT